MKRVAEVAKAAGKAMLTSLLRHPNRKPDAHGQRARTFGKGTARKQTSAHLGGDRSKTVRVDTASVLATARFDPEPDDDADPGEVVWTWVPYDEDPNRGKDRPVVVLGRMKRADNPGVTVAQMTSKDHTVDAEDEAHWGRFWVAIGTGDWDPKHRPSSVRLDRQLWVPLGQVRRIGATLPRSTWERVIEGIRKVAQH